MSIDKLLAEAARTGGLTALTIWPTGKGWQCNVQRRTGWQCNVQRRTGGAEGWSCVTADDPVAGITAALKGSPVVYGRTTDEPDVFG